MAGTDRKLERLDADKVSRQAELRSIQATANKLKGGVVTSAQPLMIILVLQALTKDMWILMPDGIGDFAQLYQLRTL